MGLGKEDTKVTCPTREMISSFQGCICQPANHCPVDLGHLVERGVVVRFLHGKVTLFPASTLWKEVTVQPTLEEWGAVLYFLEGGVSA